jgi:hypothetical protein
MPTIASNPGATNANIKRELCGPLVSDDVMEPLPLVVMVIVAIGEPGAICWKLQAAPRGRPEQE